MREHLNQPRDARLDKHDAGRFKRFEEAGRKPQRDNILVPELAALAAGELQYARVRERLAIELRKQGRGSLIVADETTRIDVSIANAMLQRDAPLPPRLARGRPGVRREGAAMLARYCDGPVAR